MDLTIATVVMEVDFFSAENFADMLKSGVKGGVVGFIGAQVQAQLMKAFNIKNESQQILESIQDLDRKVSALTSFVKKARNSDALERYVNAADKIHERVKTEATELSKSIEPTEATLNAWKKYVEPRGNGGWKEGFLDPFVRSYTGAAKESSPFERGLIHTNIDIYSDALIDDCRPLREYVETLRALHAHFAGNVASLGKLVERTADRLVALNKLTREQANDKVQTAVATLAESVRHAAYMMYDVHPVAFDLYAELWLNAPDPKRYCYIIANDRVHNYSPGALTNLEKVRKGGTGDFWDVRSDSVRWRWTQSRWKLVPVDREHDLLRIQNLAGDVKRSLRVMANKWTVHDQFGEYNDSKYIADLGEQSASDNQWRLIVGKRPWVTIQSSANNNALEIRKGKGEGPVGAPVFIDWAPRPDTAYWRIMQLCDGESLSNKSTPERPPNVLRETGLYGGGAGSPFDDLAQLDFQPGSIEKIRIWEYADYICGIQVSYRHPNGGKSVECPVRGTTAGKEGVFTLQPGETIVRVELTADWLLRSIFFRTSRWVKSPVYGNRSTGKEINIDGEVVGFFGRHTTATDAIGMYLAPKEPGAKHILHENTHLAPGEQLTSINGRFQLVFQQDGELVLWQRWINADPVVLWRNKQKTGTPGKAVLSDNGAFSVQDTSNVAVWDSRNDGQKKLVEPKNGVRLTLQDDGNLVVYNHKYEVLWTTGTNQ